VRTNNDRQRRPWNTMAALTARHTDSFVYAALTNSDIAKDYRLAPEYSSFAFLSRFDPPLSSRQLRSTDSGGRSASRGIPGRSASQRMCESSQRIGKDIVRLCISRFRRQHYYQTSCMGTSHRRQPFKPCTYHVPADSSQRCCASLCAVPAERDPLCSMLSKWRMGESVQPRVTCRYW